jgi:hypothetical protein
MNLFDKNKMSFWTRIKLCWKALMHGTYEPAEYRTRDAQKQWEICERRRRDLGKTIRRATPHRQAPIKEWD